MAEHSLRRVRGREWTIIGGVSAFVAYLLSKTVNVSFDDNPLAWSYEVAVIIGLVGLAAWATARALAAK